MNKNKRKNSVNNNNNKSDTKNILKEQVLFIKGVKQIITSGDHLLQESFINIHPLFKYEYNMIDLWIEVFNPLYNKLNSLNNQNTKSKTKSREQKKNLMAKSPSILRKNSINPRDSSSSNNKNIKLLKHNATTFILKYFKLNNFIDHESKNSIAKLVEFLNKCNDNLNLKIEIAKLSNFIEINKKDNSKLKFINKNRRNERRDSDEKVKKPNSARSSNNIFKLEELGVKNITGDLTFRILQLSGSKNVSKYINFCLFC